MNLRTRLRFDIPNCMESFRKPSSSIVSKKASRNVYIILLMHRIWSPRSSNDQYWSLNVPSSTVREFRATSYSRLKYSCRLLNGSSVFQPSISSSKSRSSNFRKSRSVSKWRSNKGKACSWPVKPSLFQNLHWHLDDCRGRGLVEDSCAPLPRFLLYLSRQCGERRDLCLPEKILLQPSQPHGHVVEAL